MKQKKKERYSRPAGLRGEPPGADLSGPRPVGGVHGVQHDLTSASGWRPGI